MPRARVTSALALTLLLGAPNARAQQENHSAPHSEDLHLDWPRAETSTNWVFMGFDEDLNEAMKIAVRETVDFLAEQKVVPMSREEAYALTSIVGDCRVSQVVDIRKGVHCLIPKSIFVKK